MSGVSKVIAQTDRNTDTQTHKHTDTDMTENITYLHTRVVKSRSGAACLKLCK